MATEKRWERQNVAPNKFRTINGRVYEETYNPLQGSQLIDTGVGGRADLYQAAADELLRAQAAQGKAMQKYPEAALAGQKQSFELGAAEKLIQDKQALNALANLGMSKELGLGQFAPPGAGMESVVPMGTTPPGSVESPTIPLNTPTVYGTNIPRATASATALKAENPLQPEAPTSTSNTLLDQLLSSPATSEVLPPSYTLQERQRKKRFLDEFTKLPGMF